MAEEITIRDKFRFDECQLQVGDIIQKSNGAKYMVVEQNIDTFCIQHPFRSSELKEILRTYIREIKD
jgi:hypothetical protein